LGYDDLGRQDRVKRGDGIIFRTVYDGLGRVVSQWQGNNDTPTGDEWEPDDHGAMILMSNRKWKDILGAAGKLAPFNDRPRSWRGHAEKSRR